MEHKVYLFDFDGTLADSMPYWSRKMINVLEKNNVEYPPDIIKTITPLGDVGTAKYFREVLELDLSIDEILAEMDLYALPKYRDEIPLKAGVSEYLEMLKREGCSLNILTASPHKMLDPCLKRNGIFEIFDNLWSCDDFNMSKSDVRIYQSVAERLGVDVSEVVFFDDNIGAIRTAAEAGIFAVGFYDRSGEDFAEEMRKIADLYVESFVGLARV